MVTFIHRGLLNPPSGVEDFVSGGTISRHVEESASLTLTLSYYDESDALISAGYSRLENGKALAFKIDVEAVGAHTDVEVIAHIPLQTSTNAGLVLNDLTLGEFATLLGADSVTIEGSGSYYEITWGVGAMTDETVTIDCTAGTIGSVGFETWEWGTGGTPGTYYYTDNSGDLSGSSNEATATGTDLDQSFASFAVDVDTIIAIGTDPATEDEEMLFTVRQDSLGFGGHSSNSVVVQISDAVTCSEPTVDDNTDGWSVGSWSSPGGGVQWQVTITYAGTIAAGSTKTITFATTPSETGTAAITGSGSGSNNTVVCTDTGGDSVTVESAASDPPYIQAVGTVEAWGGSTKVVGWPTHEVNDYAFLVCETNGGGSVTLSSAEGFAEITNSPQADAGATLHTKLAVFSHRASGSSMTGPTIDTPTNHAIAFIVTVRGVNTTTAIDATAGSDTGGTDSTSVTIPGLTTTVDNCLVLAFCSAGTDTASAQFSGWTNASLASISEAADEFTTVGGGGGIGVAAGVKSSAGAVSATTATLAGSSGQARICVAVRPV